MRVNFLKSGVENESKRQIMESVAWLPKMFGGVLELLYVLPR